MCHTKKYMLRVLRDRSPIVAFHGATLTAPPLQLETIASYLVGVVFLGFNS